MTLTTTQEIQQQVQLEIHQTLKDEPEINSIEELVDWQGNVVKNSRGADRKITDDAKELVFELIRRVFTSSDLTEDLFAHSLQQGLISQMIPIWYRHRNCVVHGGGCFPNDLQYCDRTRDQFIKCKKANDEIKAKHNIRNDLTDGYVIYLRDIVKIILNKELN